MYAIAFMLVLGSSAGALPDVARSAAAEQPASVASSGSTDQLAAAVSDEPPPSEYDRVKGGAQSTQAQPSEEVSLAAQSLRTLIALGLVVALLYLTLRVMKRFMHTTVKGGGDRIRVMARTHLEQKKVLYIVAVGRRYFLVGSAEQGLAMLTELSEKDMTEASTTEADVSTGKKSGFSFAALLGRTPGGDEGTSGSGGQGPQTPST
jgi:flagellar protein FliO/FliZ